VKPAPHLPPAINRAANPWQETYARLFDAYGPQHWWPGESAFEVMVGAVLTQNTAWRNVERAIARLVASDALDVAALRALPATEVAELIRPAGYFNVKARRLHALCDFLIAEAVADAPARLAERAPLPALRVSLLGVHGIGPETADSILLYALDLPSFVVDAYTRRIFNRLGLLTGAPSYADIQAIFVRELPHDVVLFNEYHALIVAHGKDVCRVKPRCAVCALASVCPSRAA